MGFFFGNSTKEEVATTTQKTIQEPKKLGFFERVKSAVAAILLATGTQAVSEAPNTAAINAAQPRNTQKTTLQVATTSQKDISTPVRTNSVTLPTASIKESSTDLPAKENVVPTENPSSKAPQVQTNSKNINITSEVGQAPVTIWEHLTDKLAHVTLVHQKSKLNVRNESGTIIDRLTSGAELRLTGQRKVTENSWVFVEVRGLGKHAGVTGYVSAKYLRLDRIQTVKKAKTVTPSVEKKTQAPKEVQMTEKKPTKKAAKIHKKNEKEVSVIRTKKPLVLPKHSFVIHPEDPSIFAKAKTLIQEIAKEHNFDPHAFSHAIGNIESGNNPLQGAPAATKKLAASKRPIGEFQFLPGTLKAANDEFFKIPDIKTRFTQSPVIQKALMFGLTKMNLDSALSHPVIGEAITSGKVSVPFALAAMHHGGIGGGSRTVRAYLAGKDLSGSADVLGTDTLTYAKRAESLYNSLKGKVALNESSFIPPVEEVQPETIQEQAAKLPSNVIELRASESDKVRSTDPSASLGPTEQKVFVQKQLTHLGAQDRYYQGLKADFSKKPKRTKFDLIAIDQLTKLLGRMNERQVAIQAKSEPILSFYEWLINQRKAEIADSNTHTDGRMLILKEDLRIIEGEYREAQKIYAGLSSGKLASSPVYLGRDNVVRKLDDVMRTKQPKSAAPRLRKAA